MPSSTPYTDLTQHPLLAMPQPAGDIALIAVVAVVAVLFLSALIRIRADSGTFLLVLVCGLAGCGMEGWAESMAMNYHPEIGGHIAYTAWGMPVPIHIVLSYVLYFGGPGYYFLHAIQKGRSLASWWKLFVLILVGVAGADIAALSTGAWIYYGHQPFVVFKFPLTWMFCNTAEIFAFSAIVHLCLRRFSGFGRLLTIPAAAIGMPMIWAAVCLPVGNALHGNAGAVSTALAAAASIAVCLFITHFCIGYFRLMAGIPIGR